LEKAIVDRHPFKNRSETFPPRSAKPIDVYNTLPGCTRKSSNVCVNAGGLGEK